jgi:hypothetical protein
MYAKLPRNIHREALPARDTCHWVVWISEARHSKSLIKSLKHEMASTLYTLECDQVAAYKEFHVSRY